MLINNKELVIQFKSYHDFYVKEASGNKSATVRILDETEWSEVKRLEALSEGHPITLILIDAETKDNNIRRQLTDISLLREGLGHYEVQFSFKDNYAKQETA